MDYLQQEFVMQFLMGLNESFAHVRAQILLLDHLPPLNKVLYLVVQEERQSIGSFFFLRGYGVCFSNVVFFRRCSYAIQIKSGKLPCSHCGITGHTVDKCYKVHGDPPGYKSKPRSQFHQSHPNKASVAKTGLILLHLHCRF